MYAQKFRVIVVAAIGAVAVAAASLLVATPSQAQTTDVSVKRTDVAVKKKPAQAPAQAPTQVAVAGRPSAKVTVRKRSFLDPGTETKTGGEHYMDYALPPGDQNFSPDKNDFRVNWTRMPFPSCWDLGGFCR